MKKIISSKRIVRNTLIFGVWTCLKILRRRKGKRVIAFHEVKDKSMFREKLKWLLEYCELVSLDGLFGLPVGRKPMVAVTFDDGYACWHESAAPTLAELGVPAVFFVCSGLVGLKGEIAEQFSRNQLRRKQKLQPLSKEQLRDLGGHSLFEIGSHTKNHLDLGQIWNEKLLYEEIIEDRKQLQDWTGEDIRWFAYPFGEVNNVSTYTRHYLSLTAFNAAFTLVPKFCDERSDKWMLGRDSLDVLDPTWLWHAWLNGSYDRLYFLKHHMLTAGYVSKNAD
jgi:peptidoglycan/xylan/chitin deacetylase (PgdA/CDA1 family)